MREVERRIRVSEAKAAREDRRKQFQPSISERLSLTFADGDDDCDQREALVEVIRQNLPAYAQCVTPVTGPGDLHLGLNTWGGQSESVYIMSNRTNDAAAAPCTSEVTAKLRFPTDIECDALIEFSVLGADASGAVPTR